MEAPHRESSEELLDPGTERELALRARTSVEARDRLLLANLPLVSRIARDYRGRCLPLEDLVHEGILGVLEAVRRFDPDRGTRFSTYAGWWIRKFVLAALHGAESPLRMPDHRRREVGRIFRESNELGVLLRRAPEREELSVRMATPVDRIERLLAGRATAVSLDAAREDCPSPPLLERLADPGAPRPERRMIAAECRRALLAAFAELPPRQRYVIARRLGIDGGRELSLREIGVELNLSRERVRQVETAALRVLRRRVTRSVGSIPPI